MTVATLGYTMVICGNSDDPQHRYRGRIEKVKFGVRIEEAFAHDIPATLLVLLLKVHKDGPAKKDIWRAPGNQAQVRKLSHIMQHGRLVNIANFSVYTAASVIKKFLSKLPGGIFGLENEQKLFDLYNLSDPELQRQSFCRVLCSLPIPSQHLIVLLFGTFYMISESADSYGSRMTAEALGISVAPSLFHSCIHDGQRAKMEDVMRFKIASEIISRIIQNFGYASLFPRECYEFYARITGRTLRVDENDSRLRFAIPANAPEWPVPPPSAYSMMAAQCAGSYSMGTVAAIDRLSTECVLPGSYSQPDVLIVGAAASESDTGTAATGGGGGGGGGAEVERRRRRCSHRGTAEIRHHAVVYERLSSSAGEVQIHHSDDDEGHEEYPLNVLRSGGSLESTHSLTYLEWVHERQTKRMLTRSEWFLSPLLPAKNNGTSRLSPFDCSASGTLRPHSQYDDSTMGGSSDGRSGSLDVTEEDHLSPVRRLPLPKTSEHAISASSASPASSEWQQQLWPMPAQSSTSRIVVGASAGGDGAGGVVRRRSWRTHYVRPSRTTESGRGGAKKEDTVEAVAGSSRSMPVYRRNVPHACSRGLPSSGRHTLLLTALTHQHPESSTVTRSSSGTATSSHGTASIITSQPKNVYF